MTVMPPSPPDIIDLPAPKLPGKREELPDLLTPVGPTSRRVDLPDLLTPVGPTSRKGNSELLAPVGPTPRHPGPPSLGAPAVPPPPSKPETPDLLTPVGPHPTQRAGVTDLLTPVGPHPTQRPGVSDLLTPVGPTPRQRPGVTDLLTPVGPTSTKNAPDLLTPVGPQSVRNAPDLLTPVGPEPIRNAPDLLTPVGPEPIRNAPDLLSPVGPEPTKGVELPAPKGFFDEAPPPRPAHKAASPTLDFDDLDIVPAGTGTGPTPLLDLDSDPLLPVGGSAPFSMDGLDLSPPARTGAAAPVSGIEADVPYGQVDLTAEGDGGPPDDSGLVSFARPSGAPSGSAGPAPRPAPVTGAKPSPLAARSLELATPIKKKGGTLAGEDQELPKATRASIAVRALAARRRTRAILIAAAVVVALAGGAYYVYSSVELDVGGFKTLPARERIEKIAARMASARKLMLEDTPGHWYGAAESAGKAAALQREKTGEPQGLIAQAHLAAAIDDGTQLKKDRETAEKLGGDLARSKHVEAQKAVALRTVFDPGKAGDAVGSLENLARLRPKDADIPLYLGWAALEARQWQKAKDAFVQALTLAPNREPALYGLGRANMALGDAAAARDAFQKVFDKHPSSKHYGAWLGLIELSTPPGDPRREKELAVLCETAKERETANPRERSRAWSLYGDEAMASGRYELATERYRVARDLDNRNLDALVGRAVAAVEQRSHDAAKSNLSLTDARRDLEAALRIDPRHVGAHIGLARVNLLEGRPDEARKWIDGARNIDDKNHLVHYWRGKTLEDPALTDLNGAEKAYRRAMELAPTDYAAHVALSQLFLGQAGAAEKLGRKADAKAYNDKALEVLSLIAETAKGDALMANVLGTAYLGARDLVHAEGWFRAALEREPGFVDARVNLAATLVASGKVVDAIAEYRKALASDPKREDVALSLAVALEKNRQYDEADKIYRALLSTDGGNVPTLRAHAAAGRYWARRGQLALAIEQGDIIAAAEPDNPAALYLHALALVEADKLNEAVEPLKRAATVDPQPQYYEAMGRLREKQQSLGEALSEYRKASDLDQTYADPLIGMGRVYLARREHPLAIETLERAARLEPRNPAIWKGIGRAHLERNEIAPAIAAYKQALAIDDQDPETHLRLGKAYFTDDQGADTIYHLRKVIELAPDGFPELSSAYRMLGWRYRADNKQSEKCAAFRKYIALEEKSPEPDVDFKNVKREIIGCP